MVRLIVFSLTRVVGVGVYVAVDCCCGWFGCCFGLALIMCCLMLCLLGLVLDLVILLVVCRFVGFGVIWWFSCWCGLAFIDVWVWCLRGCWLSSCGLCWQLLNSVVIALWYNICLCGLRFSVWLVICWGCYCSVGLWM